MGIFNKRTDTQKEINDFYKNYNNQENNMRSNPNSYYNSANNINPITINNNYNNTFYNPTQNEVERIFVKPRKVKPADILWVALIPITLIILLFAIIHALTTFKIIVYDVMILPIGLILVFGNSFTITKLINERLTKHRCTYRLRGLVTDVREETSNDTSSNTSSTTYYKISFIYFFNGKQYIVKNKTIFFNAFKIGDEFDIFINQNDPEDYFIEKLEKAIKIEFVAMLIITAGVIAFTAISTVL